MTIDKKIFLIQLVSNNLIGILKSKYKKSILMINNNKITNMMNNNNRKRIQIFKDYNINKNKISNNKNNK
jgi:hypothetical protein